MELYEIKEVLKSLLDEEATRIINILLDMYNKKTKVNKSFDLLIKELMKKEFCKYETLIQSKIISLIPDDLIICPTNEWIFIKEDDFNDYTKKSQIENIISDLNEIENKSIIDDLTKEILLKYNQDNLKEKNILEIIYKYIPENIFININNDIIAHIIQHIIFKINETHHVTSINPLIIEEL